MPRAARQSIVAYVPVLHKGYLRFFEAFKKADSLFIIGEDFLDREDYLRKDLRAMPSDEMVYIIKAAGYFTTVQKLTIENIDKLDEPNAQIILPDEDISRQVAGNFQKAETVFYPVFLRWDRRSAEGVDVTDTKESVTSEEFEQSVMQQALEIAEQSSDIWRRVGAVLISKDNQVTKASNQGEPHAHSPWMEGDPRNIFNRGVGIEMSVFSHAEAALIAEAARRGVALEGASIYVSTFPCPACAKLIAHSGIKSCYYKDGYAVLDGRRVLDEYGVALIRVRMDDETDDTGPQWVAYNKTRL